jgi:hypothetical protein
MSTCRWCPNSPVGPPPAMAGRPGWGKPCTVWCRASPGPTSHIRTPPTGPITGSGSAPHQQQTCKYIPYFFGLFPTLNPNPQVEKRQLLLWANRFAARREVAPIPSPPAPSPCYLSLGTCHPDPVLLPDLRPTIYHLPHTNYLSFQQHYRFRRVTTFVFYNIPASRASFPQRSFVFIDIPALLVQFLEVEKSKVEGRGVTTTSQAAARFQLPSYGYCSTRHQKNQPIHHSLFPIPYSLFPILSPSSSRPES